MLKVGFYEKSITLKIFDRRRPSWILRKMKKSFAGLFLGSSSMSMPNFDWIRWTGSKCQAKMWIFPPQQPDSQQPADHPDYQPPPHPSVKKQFIELPTSQWELKKYFIHTETYKENRPPTPNPPSSNHPKTITEKICEIQPILEQDLSFRYFIPKLDE